LILKAFNDPYVPPLPPHTTLKNAAHFMTMPATEPELGGVLVNGTKELMATVLPGKR